MKNIIKKLIITILAHLCPLSSFADPVQTSEWSYQVREQDFIPGYTAHKVRLGFRVGQQRENSSEVPSGDSLEAVLGAASERLNRQQDSQVNERDRLVRGLSVSSISSETLQSPMEVSPPQVSVSQDAPAFHWTRFLECSRVSLPLLKELLEAEARLEQANRGQRALYALKVQDLSEALAQDRGNGERTGRGIACGRFLGAAGFEVPSLIDDVKFLSALNSREEPEARFLLKVAVARFHPRSPQRESMLWQTYWKLLSIRAVFTSQRLPALEGLQEEVRAGIENQMARSEGVPIRFSDIAARTQEGFRFAEEVVR